MALPDNWWAPHDGYVARILSALTTDPGRPVLHWRDETLTAGQFAASVAGTAGVLRSLGAGPDTVVGILTASNSPGMLRARYAAHLLGAAVCHVRSTNPGSSADPLPVETQLRILLDTRVRVLVTDAENSERAHLLAGRCRGRLTVVSPGTAGRPDAARPAAWHAPALAVIGFTSGSTGRPKGTRLSAAAWDNLVEVTGQAFGAPDTGEARLLVTTPLSHTVATMADAVLAGGGSVVLHEQFEPDAVLRAVAGHRITHTFMATAHLYQLLDHSGLPHADLSSLRQLIYTGSAAAPARIAEAVRLLGPVLVQGYGTTESGRITFLHPGDHQDQALHTTVGRPFGENEIAVHDPDTEEEVAPGVVGEVWVRSPNLMDGYWADPASSLRALHRGWYRTGDLGRLDERGYLHLLGRIADVVKTDGVLVHPDVVERRILTMPGAAQAAVFGVRDSDLVEHLHAAVAPRPGARLSIEDVKAHIAAGLSAGHVPTEVSILDELPLNAGGKPDKHRLRLATTSATVEA
ncbi:class I adenylate-forming enzyme family protein [Winogradskya humida]|uniref:Fatty acid CoA ligase n=1 Tax=Winogradskya humida TaxID=113566 RepID=A0ABQ3ZWT9_9ACTN|nr:long-chain fatty acid--CoA ligase [Actinoplanes humidus]GIE23039.1 fatty acid CoA ligase [Actinoplanes humidus]